MPTFIGIGCTVSAKVGPCLDLSLSANQLKADGTKRKNRPQEEWTSTIITSASPQKWTVYWPIIGHCATHDSNALKFVDDVNRGAIST